MTRLTQFAICLALSAAAPARSQTPDYTFLKGLSSSPYGGLTQGLDGRLYSTTGKPNNTAPGEIFGITTGGTFTKLAVLAGWSQAGLVLATDGNFYGTTLRGGKQGAGRVFRLTPAGKLTTLYSFCGQTNCADGSFPQAPLIQATDGNLYGTTSNGGLGCTMSDNTCGTVFKMSLTGRLTQLYTFCLQSACPDGAVPQATLLQGSDGALYGTNVGGGAGRSGTVFRITQGGVLTTLHNFCTQSGCPDGQSPVAGLVQATDGALYGTTQSFPVVFRIALDGSSFEVLHQFCAQPSCLDGFSPDAPLIQATDGNLYGTTANSGEYGFGTVFSITTSGVLTTLHAFCADRRCSDGGEPFGPVFEGTDGNLYGTVAGEIPSGVGAGVWRLATGLGPFVSPVPAFGKVGRKANILGSNLAGATAVTFNGVIAASFTVNATGTAISAKVPAGATTGKIQVTLADGSTLSSNVPFRVP